LYEQGINIYRYSTRDDVHRTTFFVM